MDELECAAHVLATKWVTMADSLDCSQDCQDDSEGSEGSEEGIGIKRLERRNKRKHALFRAIQLNPHDLKTILKLCDELQPYEALPDGRSKRDLLLYVVHHDVSYTNAWYQLSTFLPYRPKGPRTIRLWCGTHVTRFQLLSRCIELDPTFYPAIFDLVRYFADKVSSLETLQQWLLQYDRDDVSETVRSQACTLLGKLLQDRSWLIKAILIQKDSAVPYALLGSLLHEHEIVHFLERDWSEQELYLESLRLEPYQPWVMTHLASTLVHNSNTITMPNGKMINQMI